MIVGTWRLLDHYLEGGGAAGPDGAPGDRPLGPVPLGRLLYAPDGHMAVQYMPGDRAPLTTGNWRWATGPERLAAVRGYGAYSGGYEWLGDRVAHHIEAAVYPNWIGATMVRLAELTGDRLTLRAERTPDEPPTPVLVWERLPPWRPAS
ncbi:lipocalin-like domain-containing protein [Herbidospora yilanensis]|uniref:lipocalin-like domain-containing protein n=1 Tax=Herbidospora yilanensis TaxID=354426 RepID=UPI0007815589|nr:lipocalin-like domain-containing protein [Herbidospora yilanensis]